MCFFFHVNPSVDFFSFLDILLQVYAPFGSRDGMVCVSLVFSCPFSKSGQRRYTNNNIVFLSVSYPILSYTEIAFGRSVCFYFILFYLLLCY